MRDNVAIGRKAQFMGASFEDWVNVQHEKAKLLGILAHVEKTEAHTKMVHGRLIYTDNGVSDYIGCLEGGRYLALEAKSTKSTRFLKSEVSSKQQDHLERVARAVGLALLLVEFRVPDWRQRFVVPWLDIPWQVKRTAESISAEDLTDWAVVEPECYLKHWHSGGSCSTPVKTRFFARE